MDHSDDERSQSFTSQETIDTETGDAVIVVGLDGSRQSFRDD